jgi:hypothetical protein
MLKLFLYILIFYLFLELTLIYLINFLRLKIPWIITDKDELPRFKKEKITTFLKKTFDKSLGWNWRPNTEHKERVLSNNNYIFFGKFGERKNNEERKKIFNFASFGDSFVFCRFVKNNETWQEQINKSSSLNGLNLGVGNFGLDQIYLKYLKTKLPRNIKTVFIGFVPETLSRCLCSWKHYHEFNNIYSFKPKFINYKSTIKLLNNPIKNSKSFDKIEKIIKKIRKNEFFYNAKFLKYKISFPYFLSLLKNPNRNFKLFFYSIIKILNLNENKIYEFIISENCIQNDMYFGLKKHHMIIKKLILKINKVSKLRKQKIIFLIFPQRYDLDLKRKNYYHFFQSLSKNLNIIDLTKTFNIEDRNKIYLPAKYGGHLTAYGNKIVAKTILDKGML